jgi:hypothetical protein
MQSNVLGQIVLFKQSLFDKIDFWPILLPNLKSGVGTNFKQTN